MNTALEYSTGVVQEGGRRCKKSTLNDLVHLTPLRIPLMNPPSVCFLRTCVLSAQRARQKPRRGGSLRQNTCRKVHLEVIFLDNDLWYCFLSV
jgi:hypothetical protein